MNKFRVFIFGLLAAISCEQNNNITQYPSPMEEHIRSHERMDDASCEGVQVEISEIFTSPIILFIPAHISRHDTVDLVIHFHGSAKVIQHGSCTSKNKLVTATINLGSGSSRYENPLSEDGAFQNLYTGIEEKLHEHGLVINQLILSGFSAGYGALRAILGKDHWELVDCVLLLDGLHTDYIPEGKTLYQGGKLNEEKLKPFLFFAREAMEGTKKMLITHSAIFPGTYASTTECTQYLIDALHLQRKPVLLHGPVGMQQVGAAEKGNLKIRTYAGNTAPDHMDHLHGFYEFIQVLL